MMQQLLHHLWGGDTRGRALPMVETMMKLQNVPLDQIIANPWRDMALHPIDPDHVVDLRKSIRDHGFFSTIKGRRANGKVEIACGHSRVEAARKAKLESVPIFIDDLDDDAMLRLMTDENATQAGAGPGAVMNEVAAVTRRLVAGLLERNGGATIVAPAIKQAFDNTPAIEQAIRRLRNGADAHIALGERTISRYLGQGDPDQSHRGARQVREAISALKQSGRYDEIVDEALSKHPPPVGHDKSAKDTAIVKTKERKRERLLDERTANLFSNDHQFHAFRDAVTTRAAQQAIPVDQQYALAKEIMSAAKGAPERKQVGAPFIKKYVQSVVQDGLNKQREINKGEREAYLCEQREERIDDVVRAVSTSVRSLLGAIAELNNLADEFPAHPKIGGSAARLDQLAAAIQQFSKKLK
jgi:ParB-like nuclease domain